MSVPVTESWVRALPKTDLHCHLDGSMRIETILDLARQQGVRLPVEDPAGLANWIQMGDEPTSLEDYLKGFAITCSVLQTREALQRTAYELAIDSHGDGVRYLEVRFSPLLNTEGGLNHQQVVEAVADGLEAAHREVGIRSGMILCGMRNMSPETSLEMARLAVANRERGVCAFDLAGAEAPYPAKDHWEAFLYARQHNLAITCHAGEAAGPESIADALHLCGANRIGHGVRLREDPELLDYVNDMRIPLELCPTSNVQTGAVKSFADHPLRSYLEQGLVVTLNTDNRLVSNTSIVKEYLVAHERLGLTSDELLTCVRNGWESAFLPFPEKRELLRSVLDELEQLTTGR